MQKVRENLIWKLVILLCLSSICGCKRDTLPEDAPDIISSAYHTMSGITTFRMHSNLVLVTRRSGQEHTYVLDTTAVSYDNPREITVKIVSKEDGKEKNTRFLYYDEELDGENCFQFENDIWTWEAIEMISNYEYPVPFGLYFTELSSFKKQGEEQGTIVLKGTVNGDKIVYALQESGVLSYFALTGLTEDIANELEPIQITAWMDKKEETIKKVDVTMTDSVKKMATLLYEENGVAGPEILSCNYVVDSVELDEAVLMPLPEGAEQALREALK